MKAKFIRGQIFEGKIIKEIWRDSSNNILLFKDGTYKVVKL